MALIEKLKNIGDAIRGKTGESDLLTLDEMVTAIEGIEGGGEGLTAEDLTFTGNRDSLFRNNNYNWLLEKYGNKITMSQITSLSYAFSDITLKDLSFLTMDLKTASLNGTFQGGTNLEILPKIKEGSTLLCYFPYLFNSCISLTDSAINEFLANVTVNPSANAVYNNMLTNCYSLRDVTYIMDWLDRNISTYTGGTASTVINYGGMFNGLVSVDKITNVPTLRIGAPRTSNCFSSTFSYCYRLSDIIFNTDNGNPYAVQWKNQTMDCTVVGFVPSGQSYTNIINNNSGITVDKLVSDDESYAALKDDPDWFTNDVAYSRYNHDSAVNTINSLPDTSEYLASAGGTNTIKFKGEAGSKTDGGAINTLTEEEIAVATAKGWTVTLT